MIFGLDFKGWALKLGSIKETYFLSGLNNRAPFSIFGTILYIQITVCIYSFLQLD